MKLRKDTCYYCIYCEYRGGDYHCKYGGDDYLVSSKNPKCEDYIKSENSALGDKGNRVFPRRMGIQWE